MHALIIENEPFFALLIEDHLRPLGYTSFDFAVTEAEAIRAAEARCPDLITADVELPQGCGIAAVQSICSLKRIPVVFITGTAWAVRQKMSDAVVMQKPILAAELIRVVTAITGRGHPGPEAHPR